MVKIFFHNKAFKSDSQRLAFFIPSSSSVFMVVKLSVVVSVVHTLIWRYVFGQFLGSKLRFH
ncbi:hypothetical protein VAEKB19_6090003 [Vibrio aestuarianus]|nr:hypothetical protein VAEKB19_6090003 [Vibrio aestuarianus]